MASSKNRPGIHDRPAGVPRQRCIKLTRAGQRCTRLATTGTKLCRPHLEEIKPREATTEELTRRGVTRSVRTNVSKFVLNMQAKDALAKLGLNATRTDPKVALLDAVRSSWQQAQVWEAMMASVPEEDWEHVGKVPIPGSLNSARGARIETIQRFLTESTKTAARTSKLAIDAGIEERLVRLAEEQSALIADTVRAGLIAGIGILHLSVEAERAAISAAVGSAATHLRALAAGANEDIIEGIAVHVEAT